MLNDPTGLRRSDELQSRALATPHGTQLLIKIRVMIEVKVQKKPRDKQLCPRKSPQAIPAAIQQQAMIFRARTDTDRDAVVLSGLTRDLKFNHG